MKTDLFDFELPEELIALRPATPRDQARMLVVDPASCGRLADKQVLELPDLLRPGDVLVLNNTRVIPAALEGIRERNENRAHVSFNLIKRVDASRWRAFARPAKRLEAGDAVQFGTDGHFAARVSAKGEAGEVELAFELSGAELDLAIAEIGIMPLPPYIALKRAAEDVDRASYQTIYAARDGAVAAPTAGLHFTPERRVRMASSAHSRGIQTSSSRRATASAPSMCC